MSYLPLQCSQRCGVGFQLRVVKCAYPNWKITNDENCDPNSRPNNRRYCQIKPCETTTTATTTASNGNQFPSTTTTTAPTTPREIPSWKEGSWSEVKKDCFYLIMAPNVVMVRCIYNRNVVAKLFNVFPAHLLTRADPEFSTWWLEP